jgi:hypothetical protein
MGKAPNEILRHENSTSFYIPSTGKMQKNNIGQIYFESAQLSKEEAPIQMPYHLAIKVSLPQ